MRLLSTLLAVLALVVAPLASAAQIGPGTRLSGTLGQTIDSKSAVPGTPFTLSHVTTANGDGTVTAATIYGHVTNVIRAGQGRPARIDLGFDSLRLPNGTRYAIEARAVEMKVITKTNAEKEMLGALVGMVAGNVLGKWVGVPFGGAAGAAGGFMLAKNNRQNVSLPSGSVVTVQILRARKQA